MVACAGKCGARGKAKRGTLRWFCRPCARRHTPMAKTLAIIAQERRLQRSKSQADEAAREAERSKTCGARCPLHAEACSVIEEPPECEGATAAFTGKKPVKLTMHRSSKGPHLCTAGGRPHAWRSKGTGGQP